MIAWGRMGDANASIPTPTPQPELSRPFTVRVDGEVVEADPARELPMAPQYSLF